MSGKAGWVGSKMVLCKLKFEGYQFEFFAEDAIRAVREEICYLVHFFLGRNLLINFFPPSFT
jgi:hypothetical protein